MFPKFNIAKHTWLNIIYNRFFTQKLKQTKFTPQKFLLRMKLSSHFHFEVLAQMRLG